MKRLKFPKALTVCKATASESDQAAASIARVFEDDLNDLLATTIKSIEADAARLLKEHGAGLLAQHVAEDAAYVVPKDIVCALMLRRFFDWAPPGIDMSLTSSRALYRGKRSLKRIKSLRGAL